MWFRKNFFIAKSNSLDIDISIIDIDTFLLELEEIYRCILIILI